MKGILEFNLPEEKHEHLAATEAGEMVSLLLEISDLFRRVVKYNHEGYSDETIAAIEKLRADFFEEVESRHLLWTLD